MNYTDLVKRLRLHYRAYEATDNGNCQMAQDFVAAADAIEALQRNLNDCTNELCLYCGQYKQRHKGACDGCRWLPKEETE